MGRREHAAPQEDVVSGRGCGWVARNDEQKLVIRFWEPRLNCRKNREQEEQEDQERPSSTLSTLAISRHHVVLARPRAVFDGGAYVSERA